MIKFVIKSTVSNAVKEGDSFVRYSGMAEPFNKVDERASEKVGETKDGPRLVFNTGLNPDKAEYYSWFTEDEKKVVADQIKELKKSISKFYGGEETLEETNRYFWQENRDVNRFHIDNSKLGAYYDTKSPVHALLYLSVISGAFMGVVAPTREWAERFQIPTYLALETDTDALEDEDITRSDAHAALSELRKDASPDALFIIAWCIQYDTKAYGAYLKSTPTKDLVAYHIKYIDGKLVTKKKRNTPKTFLEYVEKWKGKQSRALLYVEAYVKAGEYYNFINQKEKKYVTSDGTILGNTVDEAVTNLMKPKFNLDFEKLREQVEAKWKE